MTGVRVSQICNYPHFCHFYETKQDLLDTLVPYFKAGLETNEFCLWVVSDTDLITVAEAKAALAQAVPDLDLVGVCWCWPSSFEGAIPLAAGEVSVYRRTFRLEDDELTAWFWARPWS